MAPIAETPEPPYYVVVITTQRTPVDDGYSDMAARMFELASRQPGYLGMESVRAADGAGITSSYWADLDSIARWKAHVDHLVAQRTGQARWYESYQVRVGRIERHYRWSRPAAAAAPAEPPGPSAIR